LTIPGSVLARGTLPAGLYHGSSYFAAASATEDSNFWLGLLAVVSAATGFG